ncbi:MAG: 5'/3'-nucleotidase SurE [Candidatus Micrarchaeota archaeon]|nr:5'/3'-nucleotidase SurE [Candidatus Micrarchaeota archaeon]
MFLLSNDDGKTPLLDLLFEVSKSVDQNSFAIIPDRQRSATSKAMTFHKPLRLKKIQEDMYTLNGNPADCVAVGLHANQVQELKKYKPEVVVSGINNGHNISKQSFLTSGTIGACLEAVIHGKKAIAFSIDYRPINEYDQTTLTNVKNFVKELLQNVKRNGIPKEIDLISVNFPSKLHKIQIEITKLKNKNFDVELVEGIDPEERKYLWLSGIYHKCDDDCNDKECHHLLNQNKITITPLRLEEKYFINEMKDWLSDLHGRSS